MPREPIGKDRVEGRGRPPRTPRTSGRLERPELPPDAEIDLPPRVRKEIDRLVGDRDRARDVKVALTLGTVASEEDDHDAARRYLAWAKHLAPRSTVVREALGIALYRAGDLRGALTELQSYRRMSGSTDQNHLLADCLRADGREPDRAVEVGLALVDDPTGDIERRVEAAIVVAAVHLDAGRPARATSLLARFLSGPERSDVPSGSTVRLLWVAADAAEADGKDDEALSALERLRSIDPDYPDADGRIALLRARSGR